MKPGKEILIAFVHDVCVIGQRQLVAEGVMDNMSLYIVKDAVATQTVITTREIGSANSILKGLVNNLKPDALILLTRSELLIGDESVQRDGLYIHGSSADWDVSLVVPFISAGGKFTFEDPIFMEESSSALFEDIWLEQVLFN